MALFNRQAIVEIGKPGEEGLIFQDLRITFKGKKTIKPSANKIEVFIYNLSEDTFTQISEDGNVLLLQAGYQEDELPKNLFTGNITRIIKEYIRPDVVTKIECFDGIKTLQEKLISFSYEKGTKLTTVVDDILKNFALPLANQYTLDSFEFTNGWAFVGSTKDALTQALNIADYDWSIQDGQIQIMKENQTTTQAIVLSPTTGLIGVPEKLSQTTGKIRSSKRSKQRYKIISALFPEIKIGDSLNVTSRDVDGFFKVQSHEFEGDNRSGDWRSIIEAVAV